MLRAPDFWRTGVDFADNPNLGVNLFMVADSAGLDCYCPQRLQSSLQLALPGFLTPAFPSKHTLHNADLTPAHLHLSKLFKKVKDESTATKFWSPDQAISPFAPINS